MKHLGFTHRISFMRFVHRERVPYIVLSRRALRFDPAALEAWLKSRSKGKAAK